MFVSAAVEAPRIETSNNPTTTFHITTTCWILLRRFETPKKGQIRAFLQVSNALKRRSNAKRRCNDNPAEL